MSSSPDPFKGLLPQGERFLAAVWSPGEIGLAPAGAPAQAPDRSAHPASGWTALEFLQAGAGPLPDAPQDRRAGARPAAAGGPSGVQPAWSKWNPGEISAPTGVPTQPEGIDRPAAAKEAPQESAHDWEALREQIMNETAEQAEGVLSKAEDDADEIVNLAHQQAAEIARLARQEGLQAARMETTQALRTAGSIIEESRLCRETILAQSEAEVLGLVRHIAQSLFGNGLVMDQKVLEGAFARALAEAKTLGNLRVHVHPEDASLLGPQWTEMQSAVSGQEIALIPTEVIQRGGCFIEGQFGSLDARVDTQLRTVTEALAGLLKESDGGAQ
jgi:flagellar assembly protein FliH